MFENHCLIIQNYFNKILIISLKYILSNAFKTIDAQ